MDNEPGTKKVTIYSRVGTSEQNMLGTLPFMGVGEIECIKSYLDKDDIMFEWGSGGSTLYFPKYVKQYISVESLKHWYEVVLAKVKSLDIKNVQIMLRTSNIPIPYDVRPEEWKKEWFTLYLDAIGAIGLKTYDKILVDGETRARGFCAEKAKDYMSENSVLFIHDYYNRYNEVSWVEKYFDIIDSVKTDGTLVVMKKK